MSSNHWVIKEINKIFDNRKNRTLLIVVGYFVLIIIMWLLMHYIETNISLLQSAHKYLRYREIKDGLIRYAYITLSIGVLSIGSIMFTLLIGKIQSLVNEVNYSSFHKKTYIDGETLDNYVFLMSISIVLLINYLVTDISVYPLTYLIILLFAFLTVVYILNTLFTSLFDDLNLFRILEKNYESITLRFDEFKKSHKELERLLDIRKKISVNQKGKLKLQKFDKKIKSLRDDLEKLSNLHYYECKQSVDELDYIVVTACRRKDPELLKATLNFTNIHIKHHIEVLNYYVDESVNFWSEYALGKTYGFIIYNCIPIYKNPELRKAELNLTEIAHERFTSLMFDPEVFKPGNKEIDDTYFRLLIDDYCFMTIKNIRSGLHSEIYWYSLSIENMLEKIELDSMQKLLRISSNNITLAHELISISDTRYLGDIFNIQSKIMRITILNNKTWSSNFFALLDFFEIFEKYVDSIDAIKTSYIMYTVSSCLDNDEYDSISQILTDVFNNLDSRLGGIKSLGYEIHLSNVILNQLEKRQISISKAISIDESVFYGFDSILNRIMDILRKNMSFQKTTYHKSLMEKSLKQYCDYLLVYNDIDNWRAFNKMEDTFNKLFHDVNTKEIAIDEYVKLIKTIVKNEMRLSLNKAAQVAHSTINIEGIIGQIYGFESNLYELIINKVKMNLSKIEYSFLLDLISNLITELNTELSNELNSVESPSEIKNSEFKRDLSSLIDLFMDVSQTYYESEE